MTFTTTQEFQHLAQTLSGDVLLPGDDGFLDALKRWSTLAERAAGAVAFAKDEHDIAMVLGYVIEHDIPFAVKGGGHSASGASSAQDGIVIDLSRYLTNVVVDPVNRIVRIGGGAKWKEVNAATVPHGLATVGGVVSHTGVGGLILGGGCGYLMGRHGFAIDNLIGATVVLADGAIVNVSEMEHPDLFFALRGSGVNYGVVTQFIMRVHSIPPVCWGGKLVFPMEKLEQVFAAAAEWKGQVQTDSETALLTVVHGPAPGQAAMHIVCAYIGPRDEAKKTFELFLNLGPSDDDTAEMDYCKLNEMLDDFGAPGRNYYMSGTFSSDPSEIDVKELSRLQADIVRRHPGVLSTIEYELYHMDAAKLIPDTETAFIGRNAGDNVVAKVIWTGNEGPTVQEASQEQRKIMSVLRGGRRIENEDAPNYANYKVTDDVLAQQTFGVNYPRLQAIKAKYDPNVVFNRFLPIRPLPL